MKTITTIFSIILLLTVGFFLGRRYEIASTDASLIQSYLRGKQAASEKKYEESIAYAMAMDYKEGALSSWMMAEFFGDVFSCLNEGRSAAIWYKTANNLLLQEGQKENPLIGKKLENPHCASQERAANAEATH